MAKIVTPSRHDDEHGFTPEVLRCGCGVLITLSDGLDNYCDRCWKCYNMSGQEVLPSTDPLVDEHYDDDY